MFQVLKISEKNVDGVNNSDDLFIITFNKPMISVG